MRRVGSAYFHFNVEPTASAPARAGQSGAATDDRAEQATGMHLQPALVLMADGARLLVCPAGQNTPEVVPIAQFADPFEAFGLIVRYEPADKSPAAEPWFAQPRASGLRGFGTKH